MKMPAMQFYPADWRKDPGVQALGYFDRGVWFEMLCLMHESSERGVLLLNGKPMPSDALANVLGLDNQILGESLTKITAYGVARVRQEDGAIYSKRMVEDERICQIRREAGKKGGNPVLLNQSSTTGDKQITTPSSSSSTTSSTTKSKAIRAPRFDAQAHLVSMGVDPKVSEDWLTLRKGKKLAPTETAFLQVLKESEKAGMSMNDVLLTCCNRGWGGFDARWMLRDKERPGAAKQSRHNGFDDIDYRAGVAEDGSF